MTGEGTSGRGRMLALLAVAELLGMAPWLAGSAVAPELARGFGLSPVEVGWLTSMVQLGFVGGTAAAAVLNLADLVPSRVYFTVSALLAACASAALAVAPSYGPALLARFATGVFLAGVYPPAMKMAATWFVRQRGFAVGTIVGALTLGKASPYLVDVLGGAGWRAVVWTTSFGTVLAAVLVGTLYRDGPHAFPRRRFSWSLVGTVVRNRGFRLATAGYLGHMWELYCFWAWIGAFLAASAAASGAPGAAGVKLAAFAAIGVGVIGCIVGGQAADRIGRERLVVIALACSGACAAGIGFLFAGPFALVLGVALVWGVAVIADSAQFSVLVTEVSEPHAVGTALTLQTSLGFLLTLVTIQLLPRVVDELGWRFAFPVLALGPIAGIFAVARLRALRRATAMT